MRRALRRWALLSLSIAAGVLAASTAVPLLAEVQEVQSDLLERRFAEDLLPLVQTYCVDCHGNELQTEGLNFEQHARGLEAARDPIRWQRALQMIRFQAMPPPDQQQPTDAERARMITALKIVLRRAARSATPDPGRVTMRRLNRIEYRNTIRDLLSVDFDTTRRFPADDVGEGFDNNGDVLSLPPLLMEKYLDAAEEIAEMSIIDPTLDAKTSGASDSVVRTDRRIDVVHPGDGVTTEDAARQTLAPLVRRAFRRPVNDDDVRPFVRLVETAVKGGDSYQRGLQAALAAVLVSPEFLFRIERTASTAESTSPQPISDYQLATRLAYFIWSSMPDEALFEAAARGGLNEDAAIRKQVTRMLADPKSSALVDNFAAQWLNLRKLAAVAPDPNRFETFDDSLREAMWQETRRVLISIVREDRSILDLLDADFTFVNERLADHYGIDGIEGTQFERVQQDRSRRAGLLTHASILTLTSNPTRTSPVKRGKWILENILGTPPPEPPPAVPALEKAQTANPDGSLRQQLAAHRRDPACAACHEQMDPLGLAFENYDAIGRWRDTDGDHPVDASGTLADGSEFDGAVDLIALLRSRPEPFVRTVTEKMLTYALGRGLQFFDQPVVDKIVEAVEQQNYRFSALVVEVARSMPFRMRRGNGDKS